MGNSETSVDNRRMERYRVSRKKQELMRSHDSILDAMRVMIREGDPGRDFQQWIFDVHEKIYNRTGKQPENADSEIVSNEDYYNAIMEVMESRYGA